MRGAKGDRFLSRLDLSVEGDAGLNPKTLGSWPELKSRVGRSTDWATQAPQSVFFVYVFFLVVSTPSVGLELTIPRSRVACSADWASHAPALQSCFYQPFQSYIQHDYFSLFFYISSTNINICFHESINTQSFIWTSWGLMCFQIKYYLMILERYYDVYAINFKILPIMWYHIIKHIDTSLAKHEYSHKVHQ